MLKLYKAVSMAALAVMMMACGAAHQQVAYMQDLDDQQTSEIVNLNSIKVRPGDKLSIVVTCRDPQISALFNLLENSQRILPGGAAMTPQASMAGYTVDPEGNIDFPVIGNVHVEGLNREQIGKLIKDKLLADNLVQDPIVTVEYINLHFSVIGEVNRPGEFSIDRNRMTILEAIATAGDLTIYGKRDNVVVIREQDGKRTVYRLDLRSKDLFDSPAYYLQQNDVIYVDPNNVRAGQSTLNENNWKSVSLWVSLASVLASIAVLIFK